MKVLWWLVLFVLTGSGSTQDKQTNIAAGDLFDQGM